MSKSQGMFEAYVADLKALGDITATQSKNDDGIVWAFTSARPNALTVRLTWWQRGADFILLEIEGVDYGYWNTAEEKNLDYQMNFAKAALLGNVAHNRSPILKIKEVCLKINDSWECVASIANYHYIKSRKSLRN